LDNDIRKDLGICILTRADDGHFNNGVKTQSIKLIHVVKVCKMWCNDVYMSILQCDIFLWKLIDRNFFNPIFNTKVVLRASPLDSNGYAHLFLIEREYFGFNTLESVVVE
jgi:hypothetical protein